MSIRNQIRKVEEEKTGKWKYQADKDYFIKICSFSERCRHLLIAEYFLISPIKVNEKLGLPKLVIKRK